MLTTAAARALWGILEGFAGWGLTPSGLGPHKGVAGTSAGAVCSSRNARSALVGTWNGTVTWEDSRAAYSKSKHTLTTQNCVPWYSPE